MKQIIVLLCFLSVFLLAGCDTNGGRVSPGTPVAYAQVPFAKPMMGVVSIKVVDPVMEFSCLDTYAYDFDPAWRMNATLLQYTGTTNVVVAESNAFSYRVEAPRLYPIDYWRAINVSERYENASYYRFRCVGWFNSDFSTVTTWMQGRKTEKNITVHEPLDLYCSQQAKELPMDCQMSYSSGAVDSFGLVNKVITELVSSAVNEDVSVPAQAPNQGSCNVSNSITIS